MFPFIYGLYFPKQKYFHCLIRVEILRAVLHRANSTLTYTMAPLAFLSIFFLEKIANTDVDY